jgi:hypothetical protein
MAKLPYRQDGPLPVTDVHVFVLCYGSFYELVPVDVEGSCAGSEEDRRILFSWRRRS